MKKSLFTILILFFSILVFSQEKNKKFTSFSDDTKLFSEELDEFMNYSKNKNLEKVFSAFEDHLEAGKFNSKNVLF